jgi:hypothetical protein
MALEMSQVKFIRISKMKLKQLFENSNNQFLQTREEIETWLQKMKIRNYTIRDDLMVDVDGNVDLSKKNLSFIPVKFWEVGGDFDCSHNQLTSLNGAPREVGGSFWCGRNQLTSLKGAPREVGRGFFCYNNQLTSIEGAPREVGADFNCRFNKLTSLDGIGNVGGQIYSDLS